MKVNRSGARFSSIVGIGQKLARLEKETGQRYLRLNRGINAVCPIDLRWVPDKIDFNSTTIQVYPANSGLPTLRAAINAEYFANNTDDDKITIVAGGMSGLDLVFQTLDVDSIVVPKYHWGAYANIMRIRQRELRWYDGLDHLADLPDLENAAVVVCDPNNPVGNKLDDSDLVAALDTLDARGATVIFDSPYRLLFTGREDTLLHKLAEYPNTLVIESFSKSVGLSGQRIAFVHCNDKAFNEELAIRVLYANNGINAFGQELMRLLLTTSQGREAVDDFRAKTTADIKRNIDLLIERGLLADTLYDARSTPLGIFCIVNKSEAELLEHRIGSVSLGFFTAEDKDAAAQLARICVSVPHADFAEFFTRVPV